ncbi:MAG TPA: immunoglobulin domain-containing protein, partial [Prosthecobacter sp.]
PADQGKRVLVKDETANPAWNGVYRVNFVAGQPAGTMNLVRVADFDEAFEFVYHTPVQIPVGPEQGRIYYLARHVEVVNTSPVVWTTTILADRATTGISLTSLAGRFDPTHNGLFPGSGGPGAFVAVQTTIDGRTYSIADKGTLILVKDEQEHPEWNGVYEVIYSPAQPNGTMNLVRVANMDEVSEFGYGTHVKVVAGSSANKAYFLASTVTSLNVSAVRWVEEQANAELSLKAGVAGLTINNNIDITSRAGAGAMSLGASSDVLSGSTIFEGAITLKDNSPLVDRQVLNLDSSIGSGFGVQVRGVISESGAGDYLSLQKVGTGVATLSADSSFKGGVVVNQGTLLVMNTVGSATGLGKVQVNAGGVLGGTGRIGGEVALAGTGPSQAGTAVLRMGDPTISGGIENLTINGPLTVGPNSVVEFTLGGVNQFTKLTANSGITLTETGRLLVTLAAGYVPAVNDQFKILDLTGPLNLPPGAALGNYLKLPGAYTWDFANFATTGTIRVTGTTTAVSIPQNGHPVAVTVNPGPAVTVEFTVTVTGSPEFVYQWQRLIGANWVNVGDPVRSSSTTNKLTKTGIQESDEGLYQVVVTNGDDFTATSNGALLSVNNPPVIVQEPGDAQADPGGSATFVVKADGPSPYTFQWRKAATNITNGGRFAITTAGDTSTLVISGIEPSDEATDYNVIVSNSAGQVISRFATLDVRAGITFDSHPASVSVATGDPAFFRVVVSGTGPFQYQWQRKLKDAAAFTNIDGETGETLRLPSMTLGNSGDSVRVQVSSPVEPAGKFSNVATITVGNGVPSFLESPASKTVLAGTDLVLKVKVGGTQQGRSVVWKRNNGVIRTGPNVVGGVTSMVSIVESTEDGALVSTLTVGNISTGMGGQYSCDAKNALFPKATPTDPQNGKITVVSNPNSIVPVQNNSKTATLSVVAVGPAKDKAAITYRWLKDGAAIVDPDILPTNLAKLTIKNVSTNDAGVYTCEVTGTGVGADKVVIGGTQTLRVYTEAAELEDLDLPPAMVGSFFSYQVPVVPDASKTPDSYAAKGLPPGLKIEASTGLIYGRPTKDGTYFVTITAKNKFNPASVSPATEFKVLPVPAGAVGVFAGWLPRHEINDNIGGRYDMTVAATGAFTGKVTIGATAYPFKGTLVLEFDSNDQLEAPHATVDIPRKGKTPLAVTFTMNPVNDRFASASVSTIVQREVDGVTEIVTLTSPFNGWRNKWSAKILPATAYLNELSVPDNVTPVKPPTAGYYTFALMPPEGPAETIPQGDSYATFTVNPDGKLSMVGKTADGQAITGAQFVGPAGEIIVYQFLYKTYSKTAGGSLVGQINLNKVDDSKYADNTITSLPATAPTWFSPAYADAKSYPAGFGPLSLTATGGAYEDPTRKPVHSADPGPYPLLLGIPRLEVAGGVDPNKDNAKLEFSLDSILGLPPQMNPNLPNPIDSPDAIDITALNKIVLPAVNSYKTSLSVVPKTGLISGKINLEAFAGGKTTKLAVPYLGVIVKTGEGLRGMGYYVTPRQVGEKTNSISHQVLLSPLP